MSSCLITFTLVGPKRLSRSKALRARAVQRAADVIKFIETGTDAADGEALPTPPAWLARQAPIDFNDYNCVYGLDPEKAVDALHALWAGKDLPNDVNVRDYTPENRDGRRATRLQILVAGCSSWGDSPDGEGYRICEQSSLLGLCSIYGIR